MITLLAKLTSMLALEASEIARIFGGTCGAIAAVLGIVILVRYNRRNKAKSGKQSEQQVEQQQDTLAQEQAYLEANDNGQLVMTRNVIYSVGLNGKIRAGKYVLTNADESDGSFNVRFNGLVKEYANGVVMTLAEGDTLSPVSGSVVLAPVEG